MTVLPFVRKRVRELEAQVDTTYASSPPARAGYDDHMQLMPWLRAEGLLALREQLVLPPMPVVFLTDDWREARPLHQPHGLTDLYAAAPRHVGRTVHIRVPDRYRL